MQNLHTIFHGGCTNLHSQKQCTSVSFSPHPCQHLFSLVFVIAVLRGMTWYLIVVSICFSLMISDVRHLFMYLLPIYMSSMEKYLFRSSTHFLIGLFYCYWIVWVLHVLDISPLTDIKFANIFSHSLGCLSILLMISFAVQRLFSLM